MIQIWFYTIKRFYHEFCNVVNKIFPVFPLLLFLLSCSDDSYTEKIIYPLEEELFSIFPNEPIYGDSIETHLSTGVILMVHPEGMYQLSFDKDEHYEIPKMQIFRMYKHSQGDGFALSHIMTLSPELKGNQYVYSFICEENNNSTWALTLVSEEDYYKGKTKNIHFSGEGVYSNHLSINLITVGKIDLIEESIEVDSLAHLLLEGFRNKYTNFVIDTIFVRHAEEHPTLGYKYPKDEYWYAGKSSSDFTLQELGGWGEKELFNALDIVLVNRIEELNVLGYSGLFASNLKGGEGSTVIVGTTVLSNSGVEPMSALEIIHVALHETGHFFGLRHTTSTFQDLEGYEDLSLLEDGFDDTPYCPELLQSGLYKKGNVHLDYFIPYLIHPKAFEKNVNIEKCPDSYNIMFPVNTGKSELTFSKEQLNFLKKSITLIPH